MAVYRILKYGDPILREKAKAVSKMTPNIQKLLVNLADTLRDARGLGLAAPQIGVLKRVIVADAGKGLVALVNPEIAFFEGEEIGVEGCLSIPGVEGKVARASKVTVTGWNEEGKPVTVTGEALLARVLQHEIDHLEGILFIDRVIKEATKT